MQLPKRASCLQLFSKPPHGHPSSCSLWSCRKTEPADRIAKREHGSSLRTRLLSHSSLQLRQAKVGLTALSNSPSALCLFSGSSLGVRLCISPSGLFADLMLLIQLCRLGLGLFCQSSEKLQESRRDTVLLVKGDGSVDDGLGEDVAVC